MPCLILVDLHVFVFCVIIKYSLWFLKEHKLLVQTPPTYSYAVVEFHKVWSKLNFLQDRIECMYGQLYIYIYMFTQESPV